MQNLLEARVKSNYQPQREGTQSRIASVTIIALKAAMDNEWPHFLVRVIAARHCILREWLAYMYKYTLV